MEILHNKVGWRAYIVYSTSSRRTVRLGSLQGLYERFSIRNLTLNRYGIVHLLSQDCTVYRKGPLQSRSSQSPKTWSSPRNSEFTMELQVCAILSHTHRCFVPFAPPPLLSSEPTFSVLKNLKVLKTCMFDYKKEEIIHRGMQT